MPTPTLEELLGLKQKMSTLPGFQKDTEEDVVSDALAAPVRPEYLKFLEEQKKSQPMAGFTSPEERAIEDLNEYDKLKGMPSGQKSVRDDARLVELAKRAAPAIAQNNTAPQNNLPSAPFYPTPDGAPIKEKQLDVTPTTAAAPKRALSSAQPAEKSSEASQLEQILKQPSEYEDLLARFRDAQERQRTAQLGVGLTQAAERIGSAIAMTKPGDQSVYEQAMKQAGGITEQFKEEEAMAREAKRQDPKSPESEAARQLLKDQGITVPDTVSAAFIEKQYPQFAGIIRSRELAEERKERSAEKAKDREFELKRREQLQDDDFIFSGMKQLTGDKTYTTRNKVLRGKRLVDEALKNPSAFGDVASLYSAITALDPDSVVREGEIKLSREGMSLGESIQRQISKIGANPRLINDRLLKDVKKYVDLIDKQTEETYNLKRDALFQQAENRGITKDRYKAMDPFSLKKQPIDVVQKEKVVVEKDGTRYRLPKEQLDRALKQGYKEIK